MEDLAQLIQSADAFWRGGQLDAARRAFEQLVERQPAHALAFESLGRIALQQRDYPRAVERFRQAIAIDPASASFFGNLAEALRSLGALDEAIESYRQSARLAPTSVQPCNNLGVVLHQAGRLEEAIEAYRRALLIEPRNARVYFNLGRAQQAQGRLPEAAHSYRTALDIEPGLAGAWVNLGSVWASQGKFAEAQRCYEQSLRLEPNDAAAYFNLGNMHQEQRRVDEAIRYYRMSLALEMGNANTLCNLGNALRERGEFAEAVDCLQAVLAVRPDFAAAHSNLGVTYQDLGRFDEAQACLERAVQLDPRQAVFHFNLGTVIKDQGDPAAGIACYDRALALDPSHAQTLCARGAALLQLGRFAEGWIDYEHRARCPQFGIRGFPQPYWDGSPLAGRTLLVFCEQGLGDTLQFVRYLSRFSSDEHMVLAVQPALIPLLEQSGFRSLVSRNEPLPAFDVYCHLMSLARFFGTTLDNIPHDTPYLVAAADRVTTWRNKLHDIPGRKIGIAWQGRTDYRGDMLRSIPLACYEPLARVPGVSLLSLQKGVGQEQLAALEGRFKVIDLASSLDNDGGAFLDTAAVMNSLDLVITSDTSIAHLAGALGVPVWVALHVSPDWRWMLDRQDSPWYPSMQLFRQSRPGQWSDVFERMAAALG